MVKVTYDPQDNKKRCAWCLKDAQYVDYHDTEWGIPSHDDHHLFEHLILETFQAGLSWHTIIKKGKHLDWLSIILVPIKWQVIMRMK